MLGFADQQLVTGLSILIAGYVKYCEISVYHFSIVTDLAWLSSVTHMLTVSCLRDHFVENPCIRDSRAIGMDCFLVMLAVSCVFEVYHNYLYPNTDWSAPLRCRFSADQGPPSPVWVIHLSLLLLSHPMSILCLYPQSSLFKFCNKWVADRPLLVWDGVVQKCTEKNRELKQLPRRNIRQQCHGVGIYTTILGCIVVAFAADFVKFFFMDQCGYLYYIVGILQLFYDRWRRDQLFPLDGSENTWGFGQLVPILLIVIPHLSTVKLFYGKNPIKTLHESCASDVSLEIAEQRNHANSETEE